MTVVELVKETGEKIWPAYVEFWAASHWAGVIFATVLLVLGLAFGITSLVLGMKKRGPHEDGFIGWLIGAAVLVIMATFIYSMTIPVVLYPEGSAFKALLNS